MRSARTNQTCDWTWHHGYICWRHFSLAVGWESVVGDEVHPFEIGCAEWVGSFFPATLRPVLQVPKSSIYTCYVILCDSSLSLTVISSAQNRWFFWNLLKVNVQISTDFTTFAAVELDTGWYWMTAKMGVIRVAMGVSGWCRLENLDHTPVSQNWTLDDPNGRSRGMDMSTLPEAESTTWTLVFSHRLSKVRQSWQHPKHYHEVNLGRWRSKNLRPWFLGNIR